MGKRRYGRAWPAATRSDSSRVKYDTAAVRASFDPASRRRQCRSRPAWNPDNRLTAIRAGYVVLPSPRNGSAAGIQYSDGPMKIIIRTAFRNSFSWAVRDAMATCACVRAIAAAIGAELVITIPPEPQVTFLPRPKLKM